MGSGLGAGEDRTAARAVNDDGGAPTWTDADYTTATNLAGKCGGWTDVGGYRFEGKGHLQPHNFGELDHILFARHEIHLSQGSIFIKFTGQYFPSFPGEGTWVITGGTGAYEGLQGTGTWEANGQDFPYFLHTETGTVHWTGT